MVAFAVKIDVPESLFTKMRKMKFISVTDLDVEGIQVLGQWLGAVDHNRWIRDNLLAGVYSNVVLVGQLGKDYIT